MQNHQREELKLAKRIVLKVGSSTLMNIDGTVDYDTVYQLVSCMAKLQQSGKEILLVTSGAIGLGVNKMILSERPRTIPEKQAAAAIGQSMLMNMYSSLLSNFGIVVAQVLLTKADIANRQRYLNAKNTILTLIQQGIIPIINENDTVAYEEIKFGENDTLASLVSGLIDADLVVLLSDIEGLYTADPRQNCSAELISVVPEITADIENLAGGVGSSMGSGGMKSKIEAALIATESGIPLVIAMGKDVTVIEQILDGDNVGTLFVARDKALTHRQRWLSYGTDIMGRIVVDEGAKNAIIQHGKSLLSVGVVDVLGDFDVGSLVTIESSDGLEFARGITNYSHNDINLIKGKHSHEIPFVLGTNDEEFSEIIHRDNMVLKNQGGC